MILVIIARFLRFITHRQRIDSFYLLTMLTCPRKSFMLDSSQVDYPIFVIGATKMADKILIVDDEVESLKLIGLMLKRQGYEVSVADSGSKALSKVQTENPDLVILDVMMPDMSGLEVCRRLRENPDTNQIPIIMFTAKTLIDDKVKGYEAGADDYLTKPTHPAELANRVKSVIQRKAAEAENPPIASGQQVGTSAPQVKQGKVIGVLGVKGGVGTTTVAINIASAMLKAGKEPVISDIRIGVGSMGLMLGEHTTGMSNAIKQSRVDATVISNQIASSKSGLRVLLSSSNPNDAALDIAFDKPATAVKLLKPMGDPIIVDLGHSLNIYNAEALKHVDQLLYVIESTSPSLEMAKEQLRILGDIVGQGNIEMIVVNRSENVLPWHEAENILNREVRAIISPASELAFKSIEQSTSMVDLQPTSMVAGQFVKLAKTLL